MEFFPPSVFNLWLVESTDVEPVDTEGQLYVKIPLLNLGKCQS